MIVFTLIFDIYQDNPSVTRPNIMKTSNNDKVFSPHLQLPLGFGKTDPGDLKRVSAFLDDSFSAGPPVLLSKVFSRFSGQPDAWSGARIARIIATLFSDRMVSCVVDGNAYRHHHYSAFLETPDNGSALSSFLENA